MRSFTRAIFGLNFVYQLIVGVLCIFVPATAMGLYGAPADVLGMPFAVGAFRVLGSAILIGGVISFLIMRNPDDHPILLPIMGVLAVFTLVAEGLMIMNNEATLAQLGLDLAVQVLILIAAFGYRPRR